jgi:hypothetical protein
VVQKAVRMPLVLRSWLRIVPPIPQGSVQDKATKDPDWLPAAGHP